jgi:hypothetical protein
MRKRLRAVAVAVALVLGLLSGWAATTLGGPFDVTLRPLLVIAAALGPTGLILGIVTGWRVDALMACVSLVLAFGAYYAGTWLAASEHSVTADIIVLAYSAIPLTTTLAVGVAIGAAVGPRRTLPTPGDHPPDASPEPPPSIGVASAPASAPLSGPDPRLRPGDRR